MKRQLAFLLTLIACVSAQSANLHVPARLQDAGDHHQRRNHPCPRRFAANDVTKGIVPDSGHWIMEENPKATITLVRGFLDAGNK